MVANFSEFIKKMRSKGYIVAVKKDGGIVAKRTSKSVADINVGELRKSKGVVTGASGCKFDLSRYSVDNGLIVERSSGRVVDGVGA